MNRFLDAPVLVPMPNESADKAPDDAMPPPAARERRRLREKRLTDLAPRVVSSFILAAAALIAVWRGGTVFSVIWFIGALPVGLEWQNLIGARRLRARFAIVALALALATFFLHISQFGLACAVLAAAGAALAWAAGPARRIWAAAGIIYAGSLIVSVSALYASPTYGQRAIFWLFATVWGTDVFAYFGGRLLGGPKLWPKISPSKTWSGAFCGICAGALIGVAIGSFGLGEARLGLPIFALGLVTALVSQAGDIFESIVKRRFGVKDSSELIPGHGGFMDRMDGFIAAAAFAALVGAGHGLSSLAAGLFDWL
ncbi:MAG: phosphatidate cytidylyltransferase [Methylocella sp.]